VRQRELILSVLKLKTSGLPPPPPSNPFMGGLPLAATGGPAGLLPPRTSPLPGQHFNAAAHGGRGVSPLMGGGVFPPGGANHLAVSPAPPSQRVPSPQVKYILFNVSPVLCPAFDLSAASPAHSVPTPPPPLLHVATAGKNYCG
jgi:hypothetical protein